MVSNLVSDSNPSDLRISFSINNIVSSEDLFNKQSIFYLKEKFGGFLPI